MGGGAGGSSRRGESPLGAGEVGGGVVGGISLAKTTLHLQQHVREDRI